MKKIIVTVLALFMVVFITACGNVSTANVDLEQSETNEQTSTTNSNISIIIVDNDDFYFEITGIESDDFWDATIISVKIENRTDKNMLIGWDNVSVNEYMVDPFWVCSVSANKKSNEDIVFFNSNLKENGINTIENIEFSIYVMDDDTYDYIMPNTIYTVNF